MNETGINPASFKDPAGYVFTREGTIYRHVRSGYAAAYEQLISSGLYASLTRKEWLVAHEEIAGNLSGDADYYRTLLPRQLSFISHPCEWSFDMLKDAALLTLNVCIESIAHGMILKDATAYNIQFHQGKPLFIDTLSFELYNASQPWVAYRQFCEMFLAPLLLSYYTGEDLGKLLLAYPEGVPIPLSARLLPITSRMRMLSLLHIHLQSNLQSGRKTAGTTPAFTQQKMLNLLNHLAGGISSLRPARRTSEWSDYYVNTIKSEEYLQEKVSIFNHLLENISADTALDLGANNGLFSALLAQKYPLVVAADADAHAINDLYNHHKKHPLSPLHPLVLDITHPTPSFGWENKERSSFLARKQYGLVVALALIHHLAIGKNIRFHQLASCLRTLCLQYLIIEFVEKEDEKATLLLQRRQLAYEWYSKPEFEKAFSEFFELATATPLRDGLRTLYVWRIR